jgi:predicted ArsR family transcriptional regulator
MTKRRPEDAPLLAERETWRTVLLALTISLDGLTAEQLVPATQLPPNSVRPRLWDLEQVGLVYRAGDVRRSRYGKPVQVWRITEAGKDALKHT